jgi:tRNA (cytosine38-C5)-methyltransferase
VERAGSILQESEELDVSPLYGLHMIYFIISAQTTATFDKFLLAQANGDVQAVEILRPLRLRYFSPEELLRLLCFEDAGSDSTFRWSEGVSTKTKYRLLGNSVNVLVVSALIRYMCQR